MIVSLSALSQFSTRLLVIEEDTGVFMSIDTARYRALLIDKGFEYFKKYQISLERIKNDSIVIVSKDNQIQALNTQKNDLRAFSEDLEVKTVEISQSLMKCQQKALKQRKIICFVGALGLIVGLVI